MKETITLPHLELGEIDSPFDEAVIIINGHEEETITIECEGAAELAAKLVRLVNHYGALAALPAVPEEGQAPYDAGPPFRAFDC